MQKYIAAFTAAALMSMALGGCGTEKDQELSSDQVKKGNVTTEISCHDPQIIVKEDGSYVMTGSHQVIATSKDLKSWDYKANGNNMFTNIYDGDLDAFSYVGKNTEGGYSVWASNIFYNEVMGKYLMYFCTTSSDIESNICLATADEPEGPFTYQDKFLYSGFDTSNVDKTDLYEVLGQDSDISRYMKYGTYDKDLWPNCIDPAVVKDGNGDIWLVYGSWSGGIFLIQIDPETGLPIYPQESSTVSDVSAVGYTDPYFGTRLVGGGIHAIEGPYLEYNEDTKKYYLFLSYGALQREGGYQVRQFTSDSILGPYVDSAGNTLGNQKDFSNYGVKMMGNYSLPSLETAYMAPGGQSTFESKDGEHFIVYHQRFDEGTEYHEPRIHQMFTNQDGWYVIAPFETNGETLKEDGYKQTDLEGTFYILNHGTNVDSSIRKPEKCSLKDGKITSDSEDYTGTFEVREGSSYAMLHLKNVDYKGVIVDMTDEAGNKVRCFTGIGDNNQAVWAVQYLK